MGLNVASDALLSLNYVGVEGGCVLFVAAHGDGPAGETERKLAQAVSGFLGKQMES